MFWSKLSVEKLDRKGKPVYNNRVSPQGLSTTSGTTSLPGTNYLVSYSQSIRTGLGRYTMHLYPFFVLWGVSTSRDVVAKSYFIKFDIKSAWRALRVPIIRCLLLAQMLFLAHHWHAFFLEMFRTPSTIGQPLTLALAGSIAILVGLAVSARLWSGPGMERFAFSALAHVAALALLHYFIGIATGRLLELATPFFLVISIATGAAAWRQRRTHPSKPSPLNPPFSAWDAASIFILATLLVPLFFMYIHYDTKYVWACRAFALGNTPSFSALAGCAQAYSQKAGPTYPPIWSILLWLSMLWPALAIYAKRWHDRDKSGWWTLITLVPLVGPIWATVECGFLPGTVGQNRFGQPPMKVHRSSVK